MQLKTATEETTDLKVELEDIDGMSCSSSEIITEQTVTRSKCEPGTQLGTAKLLIKCEPEDNRG